MVVDTLYIANKGSVMLHFSEVNPEKIQRKGEWCNDFPRHKRGGVVYVIILLSGQFSGAYFA